MSIKFNKNENLTIEQLQLQNEKLKEEHKVLEAQIKAVEKKVIGFLWLFWFIPILGWVVYTVIYSKRKQSPEYLKVMLPIKEEITINELQVMHNNILIEKKDIQ
ncbi:hypothetical protein [Mesoplasma corruscae]|uniref:Uncharacterized protein n=1 Tax=Mesoplasma corruscae TaxID=216874 RepID=A0A2S5RGB1_9MOLU|nr:hypothetical protein [Mesoplasma corruscae]PPE06328.1 hypothetical protein MCORR_v1c06330 [Mesoplasma corruscae]